MHVGVVASELEGERTGVGRALSGLLGGVAEVDPGWRWTLFFQGDPPADPSGIAPLLAAPGFDAVYSGRRGRSWWWEQAHLPAELARHRLDLVFSPNFGLPLRLPAPGVVAIHDLSFERLPEEFGPRERWRRRLVARLGCRRAARVLASRENGRRELIDLYGLAPGEVGVVPLGIDAGRFAPEGGSAAAGSPARAMAAGSAAASGAATLAGSERDLLARLGVRPPYLLHLGTLLGRRRVDVVLDAFVRLRRERPELSLVVAGPDRLRSPGGLAALLAERRLGGPAAGAGGVVRLGWVPDEAVVPLLRSAELSLYLSTYEGYGLPPLESLACGTPAVVSAGLALDELWPDYPYRGRRIDAAELARVVAAALDDPAGRAAVAAEGPRRAAAWSWRRAAEVFLPELERARGGRRGPRTWS